MNKLKHNPTAGEVINFFKPENGAGNAPGAPALTAHYFGLSVDAIHKWDKGAPIHKHLFYEMHYRNPEYFDNNDYYLEQMRHKQ